MSLSATSNQEIKKQEFIRRVITAVGNSIFNWLSQCGTGIPSNDSCLFMYHNGLGCEEAASYLHLVEMKHYSDKEVLR